MQKQILNLLICLIVSNIIRADTPYDFSDRFTIGIKFKCSKPTGRQVLFSQAKHTATGIARFIEFGIYNGKLYCNGKNEVRNYEGSKIFFSTYTCRCIDTAKTHFAVFQYEGCSLNIFLDGQIVQSSKLEINIREKTLNDSVYMRQNRYGEDKFIGKIYDIMEISSNIKSETAQNFTYNDSYMKRKKNTSIHNSKYSYYSDFKKYRHKNLLNRGLIVYASLNDKNIYGNCEKTISYIAKGFRKILGFQSYGLKSITNSSFIKFKDFDNLYNQFTFTAWYKFTDTLSTQTLFAVGNSDNGDISQVQYKNKSIVVESIQDNKRIVSHGDSILTIELYKWYNFICVYNGCKLICYLGDKKVYEKHTLFCTRGIPYISGIPNSKTSFLGAIDEIMFYERSLELPIIERLQKGKIPSSCPPPKRIKVGINNDSIVISKNLEYFEKHSNLEATYIINDSILRMKIWDYDRIDNDSITIIDSNDSIVLKNYCLDNQKYELHYKLSQNQITYFFIHALNTGTSSLWKNTAAIKVYDGRKRHKRRFISSNKHDNAVIRFIPKSHYNKIWDPVDSILRIQPRKSSENINYISNSYEESILDKELLKRSYKIKDTLEIRNDTIILKVWDSGKITDCDILRIYQNNIKLGDYELSDKSRPKLIKAKLNKNQYNYFSFYAVNEGRITPNTCTVQIKDLNYKSLDMKSSKKETEVIVIRQISDK